MLFLWITAPFVEDRLGASVRRVLPGGGLAGNAAHWMRYPGADIPLVGASGAVAGLMGAFLVFFARSADPLPGAAAPRHRRAARAGRDADLAGEQMWLSRYSDGSERAFARTSAASSSASPSLACCG
jgi:hypothetical protein